jgi:hypothetical protein
VRVPAVFGALPAAPADVDGLQRGAQHAVGEGSGEAGQAEAHKDDSLIDRQFIDWAWHLMHWHDGFPEEPFAQYPEWELEERLDAPGLM